MYTNSYELLMIPFYPCIKYKIPADKKLEGSDHFVVAESMHLNKPAHKTKQTFDCSLSFTCENDQKAFYKLTKDCSKRPTGEIFRFLKEQPIFLI